MRTVIPPRPPIILSPRVSVAAVLRADREALGISGEELDQRIGWSDRYTAKAESPGANWGKTLVRIHPMAEPWLIALNRALVLMDRDRAEKLLATHEDGLPSAFSEARLRRVSVIRLSIGT